MDGAILLTAKNIADTLQTYVAPRSRFTEARSKIQLPLKQHPDGTRYPFTIYDADTLSSNERHKILLIGGFF